MLKCLVRPKYKTNPGISCSQVTKCNKLVCVLILFLLITYVNGQMMHSGVITVTYYYVMNTAENTSR